MMTGGSRRAAAIERAIRLAGELRVLDEAAAVLGDVDSPDASIHDRLNVRRLEITAELGRLREQADWDDEGWKYVITSIPIWARIPVAAGRRGFRFTIGEIMLVIIIVAMLAAVMRAVLEPGPPAPRPGLVMIFGSADPGPVQAADDPIPVVDLGSPGIEVVPHPGGRVHVRGEAGVVNGAREGAFVWRLRTSEAGPYGRIINEHIYDDRPIRLAADPILKILRFDDMIALEPGTYRLELSILHATIGEDPNRAGRPIGPGRMVPIHVE
jgi:hypothetical protein